MKIRKLLSLLFTLAVSTLVASAENSTRVQSQAPQPIAAKSEPATNPYAPRIGGAYAMRWEMSTYDAQQRFNLCYMRFVVQGNVTDNVFYKLQTDFNSQGSMVHLDGFMGYRNRNLSLTLGQQQYNFSTDMDKGPFGNVMSNVSMLGLYLSSYLTNDMVNGEMIHKVRTIGSRDLGLKVNYLARIGASPLKFTFGLYNGSGVNNPKWSNAVTSTARADFNATKNLHLALSYYNGFTPTINTVVNTGGELKSDTERQKLNMIGGEVNYNLGGFFIGGEIAQRQLNTIEGKLDRLTAGFIHSSYKFNIAGSRQVKYLMPLLRWDFGNNVDFMNLATGVNDKFSSHRVATGVKLGLGGQIRSELSLNVEKHLFKDKPTDYAINKLLQDKVVLEFVVMF